MNSSKLSKLLVITCLLSTRLMGQDLKWTSHPAVYISGPAFDSRQNKLNGELPLSIKWKHNPSGEWFVKIRGIGELDPYGISTVAELSVISPNGVKSKLITPSTDHWLPVYGYMNLGDSGRNTASVSMANIDNWSIWEITIEPVTNGDPPNYRIWVIHHRPTNQVSIQGATGRGIVAYASTSRTLELIFLTQNGKESSKDGRHFKFQAGSRSMIRNELESCDIFWCIDAPYPIIIDRRVIPGAFDCLTWKVLNSDAIGGRAISDGVLRSTALKWVSNVSGYVDKYSKYSMPDPMPYGSINSNPINFKWASELHEYSSATGPWESGKPVDSNKARHLLKSNTWRVLLQKIDNDNFIAFGICKK